MIREFDLNRSGNFGVKSSLMLSIKLILGQYFGMQQFSSMVAYALIHI